MTDEIIIDNIRFLRTKSGHYRANLALHQYVWIKNNGLIPKGFDIHHIDMDKNNNDISNLKMLTRKEHRAIHMKDMCDRGIVNTQRQREGAKKRIDECRHKASLWHKSDAGRKWHKAHMREMLDEIGKRIVVCDFCGKKFSARNARSRFCCACCKTKYYQHNKR